MRIDILTIFPEYFTSPLKYGVLARAIKKGIIEINPINLRDFTHDPHHTTDDRPYGGGEGMVMKIEPIFEALSYLEKQGEKGLVILLSPSGQIFNQKIAYKLSKEKRLIFICGRYEGVDTRVSEYLTDMELSIGDYILSGGEPAALVVIDAIARLIPGVLGKIESTNEESFNIDTKGLLEYPHYTRPREFMGWKVPEILLCGDHAKIARWRKYKSLEITLKKRPDLLKNINLSKEEKEFLEKIKNEQ